ncbi:MAG TPA: acyltransferase [Pyrinomonadaceae bacterium]|nr:acyltransferase [Pyrinomonadaceae bacterium]
MRSVSYRSSLDGVRGIAVLSVVMGHAQGLIFAHSIGPLDFSGGFIGVDIFFVLSGFLITSLLLNEYQTSSGNISLKNFYIRRSLRLLPGLLVFLLAMLAYSRFALSPKVARDTLKFTGVVILYVTNWVRAFEWLPGSDLLGHLWSLAVEEQFYLIWPPLLLVLLRLRIPRHSLTILVGGLIVLAVLHRVNLLIRGGFWEGRIYLGSDTRADSLLMGCLVAMVHQWRMLPDGKVFNRVMRAVTVAAHFTLFVYFVDAFGIRTQTFFTFGLTGVAFAVGIVILQAMRSTANPLLSVLENRFLVYVGKISYGLYLWHFFAIEITLRLPVGNPIKLVLSLLALFAISGASFYCVERPFLKLKNRFAAGAQRTASEPILIESKLATAECS